MGQRVKKTKRTKKKNSKQFNQQFKKRFFTRKSGLIWLFTFIILIGMAIGILRIEKRVSIYRGRIAELSTEIRDLQRENDDLEEQMNNANSDEYIERMARERLGMVKKGEYSLRESDQEVQQDSSKDKDKNKKKDSKAKDSKNSSKDSKTEDSQNSSKDSEAKDSQNSSKDSDGQQ